MQASTVELMRDHVRAIYRSLTGTDLPEPPAPTTGAAVPTFGELSLRFQELESLARHIPDIAERVPPFSFLPPLDAFGNDREIVVEVGVPGVERDDVQVILEGETLVIQGSRDVAALVNGQTYYRAEIPRGPFRRTIALPRATLGEPRVEVERGLIRVHLARPPKVATARA
jgi:HSP20 family molecular chaperone IbpA